ncbi:hypothetical protein [Telmatospirillum sp. J64-1]|uniref:hypothetical protein n=1 Tax=Telmatospirillum sp. J64-1 TaxID=2502183 RepID=UPI00115DF2A5|nr:hypothetical protein [Telmatospirillum sp. J64-1]
MKLSRVVLSTTQAPQTPERQQRLMEATAIIEQAAVLVDELDNPGMALNGLITVYVNRVLAQSQADQAIASLEQLVQILKQNAALMAPAGRA